MVCEFSGSSITRNTKQSNSKEKVISESSSHLYFSSGGSALRSSQSLQQVLTCYEQAGAHGIAVACAGNVKHGGYFLTHVYEHETGCLSFGPEEGWVGDNTVYINDS